MRELASVLWGGMVKHSVTHILQGVVPVRIEQNDPRGHGKVETKTTAAERGKHDLHVLGRVSKISDAGAASLMGQLSSMNSQPEFE